MCLVTSGMPHLLAGVRMSLRAAVTIIFLLCNTYFGAHQPRPPHDGYDDIDSTRLVDFLGWL